MKEKILDLLKEIDNSNSDFSKSKDFFEDELLDSFGIMALIGGIEGKFNIEIDGLDILPDNFKNIDAIERLILKYKGGAIND